MRISVKALMVAAMCISLSACETFSHKNEGEMTVTSGVNMADFDTLGGSYSTITREMSDGSVELYTLDDSNIAASGIHALGDGGIAGRDPNVMVYPFEEPLYSGYPAPHNTTLQPPAEYRPGISSPFGGAQNNPVMVDSHYRAPAAYDHYSHSSVTAGEASRIYFGHGSSKIGSAGDQVIAHVAQSATGAITVEGHASTTAEVADPVERRIVNLKMSMDRAFAVSRSLIHKGVPQDRITTKAYGEAMPVAPVDGKDADAVNRRVDIVYQGGMSAAQHGYAPVHLREPQGRNITEMPASSMARY